MVVLERKSQLTGNINMREIAMQEDSFIKAHKAWLAGTLIQNAFPNLDADDREFIMSGNTPEEWTAVFGEEE